MSDLSKALGEKEGVNLDKLVDDNFIDIIKKTGLDYLAEELKQDGIQPQTILGLYDFGAKIAIQALSKNSKLESALLADEIALANLAVSEIRKALEPIDRPL